MGYVLRLGHQDTLISWLDPKLAKRPVIMLEADDFFCHFSAALLSGLLPSAVLPSALPAGAELTAFFEVSAVLCSHGDDASVRPMHIH